MLTDSLLFRMLLLPSYSSGFLASAEGILGTHPGEDEPTLAALEPQLDLIMQIRIKVLLSEGGILLKEPERMTPDEPKSSQSPLL